MKSLFAATALAMFLTSSAQGAEVKVGQSAPPFTVKTLTGKTFRLKDARGKVVLLDFWGVACPPCKIQMPILQRWHKQYGGRGMVVIGIEAMGTETNAIRKALKERGVTYPVASDTRNWLMTLYNVTAHPTTILIDPAGKIVHIEVGYVRGDEKEIEKRLLPLLSSVKEKHP